MGSPSESSASRAIIALIGIAATLVMHLSSALFTEDEIDS
jgi:hypothetical protein